MLWLSLACSRNVPASYCDRQAQGQLLLEEVCKLICRSLSFLFRFFLSAPSVSRLISLDCGSSDLPSWALHDRVSDVFDLFFFLFVFSVELSLSLIVLFPEDPVQLQGSHLMLSVPSCLLHNPGHAPPPPHIKNIFFMLFEIFKSIEACFWIPLLLFQSGSYGRQPWVIFVSKSIKRVWFDSK